MSAREDEQAGRPDKEGAGAEDADSGAPAADDCHCDFTIDVSNGSVMFSAHRLTEGGVSLPASAELLELAERLKDALDSLDDVERAMRDLANRSENNRPAENLVHRYARAHRQRAEELASFSAWVETGPGIILTASN